MFWDVKLCVVWCVVANISKDCIAFIFRVYYSLFGLLDPEYEDTTLLRNVGDTIHNDT